MTRLRNGCIERCPGCAHRHLSAAASGATKAAWLAEALGPWRDRIAVLRAPAGEQHWNYRNRVSLAARWRGRWDFGMTVRDEVIPVPDCPVHATPVRATLRVLSAYLPPAPRFPLARYVQSGTQAALVLKTAHRPETGWIERAGDHLGTAGLEGLWLHLFPALGRKTFQKRGWELLWGEPQSCDPDGLLYGPTSFRQLLPSLYAEALDEAEDHLAPGEDHWVADLYCGNGASLRRWTARGARAVGVELGGEAVACAEVNAPAARVFRGTCATRLPQLEAESAARRPERRLAFTNPPRTGMEPEVTRWLTERCRPRRMAYLSCSAGTLHRDLRELERGGMRVERITPYDFFPHTYHVETLALLSRRP